MICPMKSAQVFAEEVMRSITLGVDCDEQEVVDVIENLVFRRDQEHELRLIDAVKAARASERQKILELAARGQGQTIADAIDQKGGG